MDDKLIDDIINSLDSATTSGVGHVDIKVNPDTNSVEATHITKDDDAKDGLKKEVKTIGCVKCAK